MSIREIRWKRGDVELVLDPDRRALVPLLRQTALDRTFVNVIEFPIGVAFDGAFIWVTDAGGKSVSKISTATNAVVAIVGVGAFPNGIAFDGAFIWVTNLGSKTVSKIDIATNTVVAMVGVGRFPFGVAFDGAFIWVTIEFSNTVSKIPAFANYH